MKCKIRFNKDRYDYFIYILIISLGLGNIGGALQLSRLLAVFFSPFLYKAFKKIKLKKIIIVDYFFLLLLFYSVISLVWTPDFTKGLKELVYYPIHMLLFLEIVYFSILSSNAKNILTDAWNLVFLLTTFVAIWEITTNNHLTVSTSFNQNMRNYGKAFASVTFGNYNSYVTFIVLICPFLFFFSSREKKGIRMILSYIPLISALFILIINGSRGGVLAFLISFTVYVFYRTSSRKARSSFIVICVGIFGLFAYYWNIMASYLSGRIRRDVIFRDEARIKIWISAWRVLKKYMFCGCGIGGVEKALEIENSPVNAAHNMFVEIGTQFGLVFLILFLIYVIRLLFIGKKSKNRDVQFFVFAFILALPFSTLINSVYLTNAYLWGAFASIVAIVTDGNAYRKCILLS